MSDSGGQPVYGPEPPRIPGYEDLVAIAEGGFAVVYRARQPRVGNRPVAIKMLHRLDPRERERFGDEIDLLAGMAHPNVVTVLDAGGLDERSPYIVLEYLEGGSLAALVDEGDALGVNDACWIGTRVASALGFAHEHGSLHRDVKPANILLGRGEAKLADFGIAKLADVSRTASGQVTATPMYAAPEVLNGEPASRRSDLYSLGATLYTTVAGRPPHALATDDTPGVAVYRAMAGQQPTFDLPFGGPFVALLRRLLDPDPERRPQNADEVADELAELADGPISERLRSAVGARGENSGKNPPVLAGRTPTPPTVRSDSDALAALKPSLPDGERATSPTDGTRVARLTPAPPDGGGPELTPDDNTRRPLAWAALALVGLLLVGVGAFVLSRSGDGGGATETAGESGETADEPTVSSVDTGEPTGRSVDPPAGGVVTSDGTGDRSSNEGVVGTTPGSADSTDATDATSGSTPATEQTVSTTTTSTAPSTTQSSTTVPPTTVTPPTTRQTTTSQATTSQATTTTRDTTTTTAERTTTTAYVAPMLSVSARALDTQSIRIDWSASGGTETPDSYRVILVEDGGVIRNEVRRDNDISFHGLSPATTYQVQITALGLPQDITSATSVTTQGSGPGDDAPARPSVATVEPLSPTSARLSWNMAHADNLTGFLAQIGLLREAHLGPGAREWIVEGLTPGQTYDFLIAAKGPPGHDLLSTARRGTFTLPAS